MDELDDELDEEFELLLELELLLEFELEFEFELLFEFDDEFELLFELEFEFELLFEFELPPSRLPLRLPLAVRILNCTCSKPSPWVTPSGKATDTFIFATPACAPKGKRATRVAGRMNLRIFMKVSDFEACSGPSICTNTTRGTGFYSGRNSETAQSAEKKSNPKPNRSPSLRQGPQLQPPSAPAQIYERWNKPALQAIKAGPRDRTTRLMPESAS